MEDEDFLAAVEADNANVPVEEPAETPQPETPVEAEPATPVEQPPAETVVDEAKPEPGFVPLTAMLDERERRQRMERELEALRAQQPKPQPVQAPDMLNDPEGFQSHVAQQIDDQLYAQTLRVSQRFAVKEHGEELTQKAVDWGFAKCAADPLFNAQIRSSDDPVGLAVQLYQREQIASEVTLSDFEQFKAWRAAQAQVTQQPTQAAPAAPSPAIPPRSLASAPAAGGLTTEPAQTDEEMFAETFPRK